MRKTLAAIALGILACHLGSAAASMLQGAMTAHVSKIDRVAQAR